MPAATSWCACSRCSRRRPRAALKEMEALAERCMADYDEDGWKDPAYFDGSDISILGK